MHTQRGDGGKVASSGHLKVGVREVLRGAALSTMSDELESTAKAVTAEVDQTNLQKGTD